MGLVSAGIAAAVAIFSWMLYLDLEKVLVAEAMDFIATEAVEFGRAAEERAGDAEGMSRFMALEVEHLPPGILGYRIDRPGSAGPIRAGAVLDPDPRERILGTGKVRVGGRDVAVERRLHPEAHYSHLRVALDLPRGAGRVEITQFLRPEEKRLARTRRRIFRLAGGTLVVSLLLGWWLSGRILRPIRELARFVGAVRPGPEGLRERLPARPGGDELERIKSDFNRMMDALQQGFERERASAAAIAHELRNPLTVLRGEVEWALARTDLSEPVREALERHLHEVEGLSDLVEKILFIVRMQALGGIGRSEVPLGPLLAEVRDFFLPAAEECGVAIDLPPAPGSIYVDPDMAKRLFSNLLGNALRFAPEGSRIAWTAEAAPGGTAVSIVDRGPGIPAADRRRVFEPFARLDPSRSRDSGGAGMGLAICAAIVRAHGGTISFEETPGGGATCRVLLPGPRD